MFVCLCNAISDKDLRRLSGEGVKSVDEAYHRLGGQVQCGQCRSMATSILQGEEQEPVTHPVAMSIAAE